jgi:hypothetical protein
MNNEPKCNIKDIMPIRIGKYAFCFGAPSEFEFIDSEFWKFKLIAFKAKRIWKFIYKITITTV